MFSDYTFNKLNRIGSDSTDNTQINVQNTKFANYMLSSYFSESLTDDTINFVSQQPTMNINGLATGGKGLNGHIIDDDSNLIINIGQERPLEKLQLMPRPFLTVPYLGKGSADPNLESQLLQGENIYEKKSVSTIMDKSFMPYMTLYPTQNQEDINNPKHKIEESALDGWVRGGASTREYY
jgi:hypothetical protein